MFDQPIPLFPLPACPLLPHVTVPLHVFEPRYRQMVQDVLERDQVLAMAVLDDVSQSSGQASPTLLPSLRPWVCVGQIVQHQKLPDGRYYVLLHGICRAMLKQEVEPRAYRRAMLAAHRHEAMDIDLHEQRERLMNLLQSDELTQLAAIQRLNEQLPRELPTDAVVDVVIATMCQSTESRYAMLEQTDPAKRSSWLEQFLKQTRDVIAQANRFTPSIDNNGCCVN